VGAALAGLFTRAKEGKRDASDDEGLDLAVDSGQVALIGKRWQVRGEVALYMQ
jgi:hypothetical protein